MQRPRFDHYHPEDLLAIVKRQSHFLHLRIWLGIEKVDSGDLDPVMVSARDLIGFVCKCIY